MLASSTRVTTKERNKKMLAARETRSQAKTRKYLESLHPQCAEAFKEGLGSVLRQWTALELAIHHQWGGKLSKEKADELNSLLADMFMNPEKVYKDDVSLVLEDFMEVSFNTICEDGSADEVSDLLCTMWRQCSVGDFTLVHNALAREYVRHEAEILNNSQGVTADGDADDEMMDDVNEEDDAAMEDEDNTDINDVADTAADVDMNQVSAEIVTNTSVFQIVESNTTSSCIQDDDGWETVQKGKNAKIKGRKSYKI